MFSFLTSTKHLRTHADNNPPASFGLVERNYRDFVADGDTLLIFDILHLSRINIYICTKIFLKNVIVSKILCQDTL